MIDNNKLKTSFRNSEEVEDQTDEIQEKTKEEILSSEGSPEALVEKLQQEVENSKDQLLRTLAEIENLRKRTHREKEETRQYAITGFARDLLSVADNFKRAFEILDSNLSSLSPEIQNFIEGLRLTEKEFLTVLTKHGIQKVSPLGEKFDHNLHQAMFEGESADYSSGTVMQVLQEGYTLNDRLLRPAMVGVSK